MKRLTVSPTSKAILIPIRRVGTVTNLVTYCQAHPDGLYLSQQDYLEACGRGLSDFLIKKDVLVEEVTEKPKPQKPGLKPIQAKVVPPKPATIIKADTLVIEDNPPVDAEKPTKKPKKSKKK